MVSSTLLHSNNHWCIILHHNSVWCFCTGVCRGYVMVINTLAVVTAVVVIFLTIDAVLISKRVDNLIAVQVGDYGDLLDKIRILEIENEIILNDLTYLNEKFERRCNNLSNVKKLGGNND